MSAIAGIFHLNHDPVNKEHSSRMMKKLHKFPADDIRTWSNHSIFLGCHAQWITPESIGEILPYFDSERKIGITADVILDNREELCNRLFVKKEDRNLPDSQLILLSYLKWKDDCTKYLIGDYAFMIWDEKEQKLFGARDPSGYRTLYYYHDFSRFIFCTTIEPLLSLPGVEKELNEEWVAEFLAISGTTDTVDASTTPYQRIFQLPPFHSISVKKDSVTIKKYGSYIPEKKLKLRDNEEYVEAFQEVFQKAVNSRLRTFRNVGAQLSGGLDSGSVVGCAGKLLRKENKILHTFSYIPPADFIDYTPTYLIADESPLIKKTVQYVGGISDHYFDFEGKSSYSEIDEILDIMEMPYKFLENSFWLKGMFEKAREKDIGILLNGDRGNFTISWGSAIHYYELLLKRFKLYRFYTELGQYCKNAGGNRKKLFSYLIKKKFLFLGDTINQNEKAQAFQLINKEFAEYEGIYRKLREFGISKNGWFETPDLFEQRKLLYDTIHPWNSGNTLNSKLSLKHSLWKRDPTNDIRVVRFCLSLPEDQYVQNGFDRALIRRATKGILPDEIRLNQSLRGVQAADWMHRIKPNRDSIIEEANELMKNKRIMSYLNNEVSMLINEFTQEKNSTQDYKMTDLSLIIRCIILYRFVIRVFERG